MIRKIPPFLLLIIAVFCLNPARIQARTACFQCHEKSSFVKRVVHEPLDNGKCTACHNPHVARFPGLLQKKGADLCYSCHGEKEAEFAKGIIHLPIKQGKCLACHDPHASESSGLVKGKLAERCFACHEGVNQKYKVAHKPFAKGQCSLCHRPHVADNPQFLKEGGGGGKMCRNCHSRSEISGAHKNFPSEVSGCLSCHNPHGSSRKKLIRDVLHEPYKKGCDSCHTGRAADLGTLLCLKCHQGVKDKALGIHNHLTGGTGNSCTQCHSPHAGDEAGLIKGQQKQVCRKCHVDVFEKQEKSIYTHMIIVDRCSACHDLHGSNRPAMLKADGITLCMNCHESQGDFSHPVGQSVKDPRTGLAMDCVSCHNPHGTDFKGQLRLSGARELCVLCHHM